METLLGLLPENCSSIKLDIEEYLIGLTHLSNELVTYCCETFISTDLFHCLVTTVRQLRDQ